MPDVLVHCVLISYVSSSCNNKSSDDAVSGAQLTLRLHHDSTHQV